MSEKTIKDSVKMQGRWRVRKYKRGSDTPHEITEWKSNSLVTSGRNQLIDLVIGTSTSPRLNDDSVLRIYNSAGTSEVRDAIVGTSDGPTHSTSPPEAILFMEWTDGSDDTYTPERMRLYFPGNSIQFSDTSVSFGTKPTSEVWIYECEIRLNRVGSTITLNGQDRILRLLSGNSTDPLATNTVFEVRESPSATPICEDGDVLFDDGPETGYPQRDGDKAVWLFEADQAEANGDWDCYRILRGSLVFRSGSFVTSSPGTKTNNEIYKFTYSLTIT